MSAFSSLSVKGFYCQLLNTSRAYPMPSSEMNHLPQLQNLAPFSTGKKAGNKLNLSRVCQYKFINNGHSVLITCPHSSAWQSQVLCPWLLKLGSSVKIYLQILPFQHKE